MIEEKNESDETEEPNGDIGAGMKVSTNIWERKKKKKIEPKIGANFMLKLTNHY